MFSAKKEATKSTDQTLCSLWLFIFVNLCVVKKGGTRLRQQQVRIPSLDDAIAEGVLIEHSHLALREHNHRFVFLILKRYVLIV